MATRAVYVFSAGSTISGLCTPFRMGLLPANFSESRFVLGCWDLSIFSTSASSSSPGQPLKKEKLLIFRIVADLQKDGDDSTESSHLSHTQFPC